MAPQLAELDNPSWIRQGVEPKSNAPAVNLTDEGHGTRVSVVKGCVDLVRGFLLNDHGNAERLKALHGSDLRYCHSFKKWLIWDSQQVVNRLYGTAQADGEVHHSRVLQAGNRGQSV